jgi:hypothetical protein
MKVAFIEVTFPEAEQVSEQEVCNYDNAVV